MHIFKTETIYVVNDFTEGYYDLAMKAGSTWRYTRINPDNNAFLIFTNCVNNSLRTMNEAQALAIFGLNKETKSEITKVLEFEAITYYSVVSNVNLKRLVTTDLQKAKNFLKRHCNTGFINYRTNKNMRWKEAFRFIHGEFKKQKSLNGSYVNFNKKTHENKTIQKLIEMIQESGRWSKDKKITIIKEIEGKFGSDVDKLAKDFSRGYISLSELDSEIWKLFDNEVMFNYVPSSLVFDIASRVYETGSFNPF